MYRILHIPTGEYLRQYSFRASEINQQNQILIHPKNHHENIYKMTEIATFIFLSDVESALNSLVTGFKGGKAYRLIKTEFDIVWTDDV